jgi:DNA-binding XRE family transcriptional regulator
MSNARIAKAKPDPDMQADYSTAFKQGARVVRPLKGKAPLPLALLRKGMGKTQEDIAEALGTDQGEISRIERRGDVRLSTLRRYAEAVGARLELAFVFEKTGGRAVIEGPDPDADPVR